MASSPKPPKWAAKSREISLCEKSTDLSSDGERKVLGKWARGSQVGAQVRSATDLCCLNVSSGSCGQSIAQSSTHHAVTKEVSQRRSAGSAGTSASERPPRGSDARPWQFSARGAKKSVGKAQEGASVRPEGASVRSALDFPLERSAVSSSCPDLFNVARSSRPSCEDGHPPLEHQRGLRPLPPKPRFPPPLDQDEEPLHPMQIQASLGCTSVHQEDTCLTQQSIASKYAELRTAPHPPCRDVIRRDDSTVLPERRSPGEMRRELTGLRDADPKARIAELPFRRGDPMTLAMLAELAPGSLQDDLENVPPCKAAGMFAEKRQHGSMFVSKSESAEEFQAKVSCLFSESISEPMRSQLGHEASDVAALLRRVETVLRMRSPSAPQL